MNRIALDNLVGRMIDGDRSEEDKLAQYLLEHFEYIARRRLGTDDANDVAQEACITVMAKLTGDFKQGNFEVWACEILRNKIGNYYQKEKTRRKYMVPMGETVVRNHAYRENPDFRRRLLQCFRALVRNFPRYARVVNLINQGFKIADISDRMSIKTDYLYVVLNRGRSMLKDCLERNSHER